jgi:predicted transcriptional regulator
MSDIADVHVAELAVRCPTVHEPSATVGDMRALFLDDHVHMALIVQGGKLLAALIPPDLRPELPDGMRASLVGALEGRTVTPSTRGSDALTAMSLTHSRRLAVTAEDGSLVGLLCLKSSGRGFCSDADVASRRLGS